MTIEGEWVAAPVAADPVLEQLLLALADGSYVLGTPDGAVAECGAAVLELLGASADELVGQRTAEVLVASTDGGERSAFEQLMHAERVDVTAPRTFGAQSADGAAHALRFVVVAVPLALGWEFTTLLGELGSRDATTWNGAALRARHARALAAIEGVVRDGAQPEPGARLAGILIVVRDVDAPPLTREDVDARVAERREAARLAAAAVPRADEAGDLDARSIAPELSLDDLVERAHGLRERVEEAEHDALAAKEELAQALVALAESEAERDAATARAVALHADDERVAQLTSERDEARARLEASHHDLHAVRAEAGAARARAEAAIDELQIVRADAEAAQAEASTARADAQAARSAADALRAELQSARADLAATAAELERIRAELDGSRAATEEVRAEREQARIRAQQLQSEADHARAAAEAIRAEFAFEPMPERGSPAASQAPRGPRSAPAQMAGDGSPAPTPRSGRSTEPKPEIPAVGPGQAAALIALDGAFSRLDDAFCALLGCREEDLRAARWPSIIDRENLDAHREIARRLQAGEIASAEIETVYMHAQGLLVPIEGTIAMHRADPAGPPTHFLFRADVSRTAGVA